jgi:hypothetical protein
MRAGSHEGSSRLLIGVVGGSIRGDTGPGGYAPPGPEKSGYAVACGQVSSIHLNVVVGSPLG